MSSLDSLSNDVAHQLSAAVDLSRIMGVFNTFVGIIKDQQTKLDQANEEIQSLRDKVNKLAAKQPSSDRLDRLESKLDGFIQDIQGGGDMDRSILHADISPFAAFSPSNPIQPIMEEDDEDDHTLDSSKKSPSKNYLEDENSIASLDKDSLVGDQEDNRMINDIPEDDSPTPPLQLVQPSQETVAPISDLVDSEQNQVTSENAGEEVENAVSSPVDVVSNGTAESDQTINPPQSIRSSMINAVEDVAEQDAATPQPQPSTRSSISAVPVGIADAGDNGDTAIETAGSPAVPASTQKSIPPSRSMSLSQPPPSTTASQQQRTASIDAGRLPSRSYSIVSNGGTETRHEDNPFLEEISSTLPLVIEALRRQSTSRPISGGRPLSGSTSAMPSGSISLTTNNRPLSGSLSSSMTVNNRPLSGLNSGRKLNSLLVRRKMDVGRLPWLTPARAKRLISLLKMRGRFILISKKIMEESRKKYGAASLKNRIDVLEADLLRMQSKMENMKETMKKSHAAVKELVSPDVNKLLEELGRLMKAISMSPVANVDHFVKIVVALKDAAGEGGGALSGSNRENLLRDVSDSVSSSLSKELKESLDSKFTMLSKEYVSKQELMNLLKQGTALEQNIDSNHLKLLSLIDKCIKPPLESLDSLRVEGEKKIQERLSNQHHELMSTLTTRQMDIQQDLEERVRTLTQQMMHAQRKNDMQGSSLLMDDEFVILKAKLKKLEEDRDALNLAREKESQQRQSEHEALKILQRRLANISIDKLMEELKDVRDEVKDRPSTHQVEHMVGKIEKTFKSHLGENVNGLTNLVGQVYKYLQTKVDREDIRNLITSKLMQMEQELIYREEEMLTAAGTSTQAARCISCGQLPAVQRPRTTQRALPPGSGGNKANVGGSQSPLLPQQSQTVMDDELMENSPLPPTSMSTNNVVPANAASGMNPYSFQANEQVYSLLTGQVGLRPLHLQHQPLQPRDPFHAVHSASTAAGAAGSGGHHHHHQNNNNNHNNSGMHGSRPHTMATSRVKPAGAEKIPEPMFRKAKMAQQMKEMVKVASPALDAYGYHAANNPFFVTDTTSSLTAATASQGYTGGKLFHPSDASPSLSTLHNTFGGVGGGGALRGTGAHIVGSSSLSALPHMDNNHSSNYNNNNNNQQSHHHVPQQQQGSNNTNNSSNNNSNTGSRRVSAVMIDADNLSNISRQSAF